MKKLLSSIIILLALCIACPQVYSAGTATRTVQLRDPPDDKGIRITEQPHQKPNVMTAGGHKSA